MTNIDRYAVFGNPIKHSKSPQIHALFAEQTQQQLNYRAHKVEEGRFDAVAKSFFENGGKGLNITVPFKLDAFSFADQLSERAQYAGALNTLALRDDGSIFGDNTDGIGLLRDIRDNLNWNIAGKRVLILGAGGAVRGILEPLMSESPAQLLIANRTASKAEQLAKAFTALGTIEACGFNELTEQPFDLIINGTSAGLTGELPPLPDQLLSEEGCCYDLMYGNSPSQFMRWGAEHAAWAVADGLGMLVEQAAESFYLWRGVRPETGLVIKQLREELS
jgi:shikimate dehydrogenase